MRVQIDESNEIGWHRQARFFDDGFYVDVFPSHGDPAVMALVLWDSRHGHSESLRVPDWLIAAWHAGDPIEPLMDWLFENYPENEFLQKIMYAGAWEVEHVA